jgi:hypothetical protein
MIPVIYSDVKYRRVVREAELSSRKLGTPE